MAGLGRLLLVAGARRWLAGLLLAAISALASPAMALEQVTLQLKWTHAFQFAGYYAAKELGYYREAGLDVRIEEGRPEADPLQAVLDGKAQFGIGMSNLLLQRQAGKPVVVLAVIFQHSPLVIISRDANPAHGIHQLVGKRVMFEPQSDELFAYLKQERIPLDRLQRVEHSFNTDDLLSGKVDAISAYVTNEPFSLDRAGMPYQVFTPRAAGIDFYGDNLFTTEQEISKHPQRVEAFRAASLRGWRYAMAHPEEIAELIYAKYSQRRSVEFYLFEAKRMAPLLRSDLIEIGYMNPGRWRHIAATYADLGLLPANFDFTGLLYAPDAESDWSWLIPAAVVVLLAGGLLFYIIRINRRLAGALAASQKNGLQLRENEQKYRMLAENIADVVWVLDPETLRFLYVSPSVVKLCGYTPDEAMALPLADVLRPEDRESILAQVAERVGDFRAGRLPADNAFIDEFELLRKDGSSIWTEMVTRYVPHPESGRPELHGVSRDISERKRVEAHMRKLAQRDPLTGLANRAIFQEMFNQALANARRDSTRLALLFLDLDRFKPVNDNYGHGVGDLLLRAVAERIQAAVRESDTVARIGGDEFVVLLRNVGTADSVLAVAEKIRQALNRPFAIEALQLEIAASIGVALYPEHGSDAIELTKHADDAMYAAKNRGRNSVQLHGAG